jgi:hypothetical protein
MTMENDILSTRLDELSRRVTALELAGRPNPWRPLSPKPGPAPSLMTVREAAQRADPSPGFRGAVRGPKPGPIPIREAALRRMPLDGVDAEELAHALEAAEKERDAVRDVLRVTIEERDAVREELGRTITGCDNARQGLGSANLEIQRLDMDRQRIAVQRDAAQEELEICQTLNAEQVKLIQKLSTDLSSARGEIERIEKMRLFLSDSLDAINRICTRPRP